jgi:hypothetical protein
MTVKALITGASGQQCGKSTVFKYEIVSDVFARALRDGGCEVEHRVYELGEDLRRYDVVFLGLVPFFSVAGHYVLPAMRCLEAAEAAGVPLVFYVDDWRFYQFYNNLRSIRKNPLQLVKSFFDGRAMVDEAREHLDEYTTIVDRLSEKPWPLTIAPAYAWGDHAKLASLLQSSPRTEFVDVTPYLARHPLPSPMPVKDRSWVLGTASNQLPWLEKQGVTWPVHHFGGRASKAPRQLTEPELAAEYCSHWGVLSPSYGYRTAGTGWWRSRFVFAAQARAVLLCDPDEAPNLGPAYANTASEIEALSDAQLAGLAEAQRDALRPWIWKKYQVVDEMLHIVNLAREMAA